MKTIDSSITSALGSPRTVNLRYTARDTLLKFDPDEVQDSLGQSPTALMDAAIYSTGVLRATNYSGTLYIQEVDDLTSDVFASWTNTGIALKANSIPGVEGGDVWFQTSDGNIKSATYSGSLGTPTTRSTAFTSYTVNCAPVSTSECFIHYLDGSWGAIARIKIGSSVEYWSGRVYGSITSVQQFDAVTLNSKVYLYFSDDDNGRMVELVYNAGLWSQTEHVIPLDIVDDISFYKLASASVIDGKIFLAARLSRPNDGDTISFDAYFMGPRPFSMGRDMYLTADSVNGKMFLIGTTVWYLGANMKCDAPATNLVGVDAAAFKTTSTDIVGIGIKQANLQPTQGRFELPYSATHAALNVGKEIQIEAGYNDVYSPIARFIINDLERPIASDAGTTMMTLMGKGFHRVLNWTPDMNYDMTGHGYISDAPNELTSVIRARGIWEISDSSLVLNYVNELGVLYAASRPGRGGMTKAKFYNPSGGAEWNPEYGVGINYRQEAKYEAAERLSIDFNDVTQNDYGDNGIVAIYGPTQHSGGAGVGLYSWVDSNLVLLTSASLSIPDDTWHWLSIYFVDGAIRVAYRLNSSTAWTSVLTHTYTSSDLPWKKDFRGHGFLYLENVTNSATAYPSRANSMILGMDSVTNLPSSGTIIIGREQITFSAKTGTTAMEANELDVLIDQYFHNDDIGSYTGFPIVLDTEGAVAAQNAYDGYALVVTDGPGKGMVFTVEDYDYAAPQVWVPTGSYTPPDTWQDHIGEGGYGSYQDSNARRVFVTEDPKGALGTGSKVRVVPSVTVTARGANSTNAISHEEDTASVYFAQSVKVDWFEAYDNEIARRLEDVISNVAAYAGVPVAFEKHLSGAQTMSTSGWNMSSVHDVARDTIPMFDVPALDSGEEAGVAFRMPYEPMDISKSGGDSNDFESENWDNITTTGSKVFITWKAALNGTYGVSVLCSDNTARYMTYDMGSAVSEANVGFSMDMNTIDTDSNDMVIAELTGGMRLYLNDGLLTLKYYDNSSTLQTVGSYTLPSGKNDLEVQYKAGSGTGYAKLILNGTAVISGTSLTNDTKTVRYFNLGAIADIPAAIVGEMWFDDVRYSYGGPDGGYLVTLYYDGADYHLKFYVTDGTTFNLVEQIQLWFVPKGTVRVAVIDDHFSVWIDGLYTHTFRDGTWTSGTYVAYVMYGAGSLTVDLSTTDLMVESFILDNKGNGFSALAELLKDHRMYMVDDQTGGLRVFKDLSDVGTLPDIVYEHRPVDVSELAASRVRGEGFNVVEIVDFLLMQQQGHSFAMKQLKVADDLYSSIKAVNAQMQEWKSLQQQSSFETALDFRLEPGDIATFQLPTGNEKHIIIEVTNNIGSGNNVEVTQSVKTRRHPDELT